MDKLELVYLCYSRKGLTDRETATFERVYSDGKAAIQWVNKKNCQCKRYYFWVSETLRG